MDQNFVADVIETRKGQVLTDEQARAADDLLAVKFRRSPLEQRQYRELGSLFLTLETKAKALMARIGSGIELALPENHQKSAPLSALLDLQLPANLPEDLAVPEVKLDTERCINEQLRTWSI